MKNATLITLASLVLACQGQTLEGGEMLEVERSVDGEHAEVFVLPAGEGAYDVSIVTARAGARDQFDFRFAQLGDEATSPPTSGADAPEAEAERHELQDCLEAVVALSPELRAEIAVALAEAEPSLPEGMQPVVASLIRHVWLQVPPPESARDRHARRRDRRDRDPYFTGYGGCSARIANGFGCNFALSSYRFNQSTVPMDQYYSTRPENIGTWDVTGYRGYSASCNFVGCWGSSY